MNSVPIYTEKLLKHSNGSTFKVLSVKTSSDSFFLEYPSHLDPSSNRLLQSQIKSGITPSFSYKLEIKGVGYRAWKEGNTLFLNLGKAVPFSIEIPASLKVEIKKNGVEIDITGRWKSEVSLLASQIRDKKPSHKDRYKQKGILFLPS